MTVAATVGAAQAALDAIFREGAGARVVIEEFMAGEEASLFVLADGEDMLFLGTAQDHKRAFDGDAGPEHRRHGRLLAGAGDDAGGDRGGARRASCARRSPRWSGAARRSRACSTPG